MNITILGGGLSAISLAFFLQNDEQINSIDILEKDEVPGGLCRSYQINNIFYDVGPHIIFSKDEEVLSLMNGLLGDNINKLRRSNRILYKQRFVQYPFENDLSKLPEEDIKYCVNAFLNNPYEEYAAESILQFFLKTFGEGITNTYLRPYNEKIWKFDPAFMDVQMVERIPKPPKEDILKSAAGETIQGYLHQLFFTYPQTGGIEALVNAFIGKLNSKVKIHVSQEVLAVSKCDQGFKVNTRKGSFISDKVVSTIPANILCRIYQSNKSEELLHAAQNLKYNSIMIAIVNVKPDKAKDNFAFMIADKNIKFHRLSKIDFLGDRYHENGSTTYMLEITYRKGDLNDLATDDQILKCIFEGLEDIGFIEGKEDINFTDLKRFEYAYVIYDMNHRKNMDTMKNYFNNEGIYLNGRFGTFEYLNMDAIIRQSINLSKIIK